MFELHNPIGSRGDATENGGFQSLVLNNEYANISDATNRQAEFSLSDDVELLEVRVSWTQGGNPTNQSQVKFESKCFDIDGAAIWSTRRLVVLPFVSISHAEYRYFVISTPSEAKKIVFTSDEVNLTIVVVSRTTFKEPQS